MSKITLTSKDFRAFAEVRKSGIYDSMLDSNARHMAGLPKEKWLEIIAQYEDLENIRKKK